MFFQFLWFTMIGSALLWAMLTGQSGVILPAALESAANAIQISLQLLAGYLFFCGMIAIVSKIRLQESFCRVFQPVLCRLLGKKTNSAALEAVGMNLSANLLGLGNAATPYGMKAAQLLDGAAGGGNRHGLYMLLIINATSIQLLPTTVLTLRIGAGSADPNAIVLPSLAATAVSTGVGVLLGLLCRKMMEAKDAA